MLLLTSGDPLADRRHAHAMGYRASGDHAAAAELLAQALERAPEWAAGWFALGEAAEAAGQIDSAAKAYQRALTLDESDRFGAHLRLARLTRAFDADAWSPGHVAALFDDYAPRFEAELVDRLAYRGPALLVDAVRRVGARRFRRMIDLGCGTGLAGEAFAPLCEVIDGIDLSEAMLERARAKRLYRSLALGEIVATLAAEPEASAGLLVAADVVVYLGDLRPLLGAAARVLRPGGLLAFTAERSETEPVLLGDSLRFAHSEAAIGAWAAAAGLVPRLAERSSKRRDRGEPVPGLVLVLEKPRPSP
jgi:predicted TPR repeat methyltransferase